MKARNQVPGNQQRGAMTLLVTLMLLLIMAIISLTTARIDMTEQHIVGNDLRAREAREAAEAGLEFAVAWATETALPSADMTCVGDDCTLTCPGDAACPDLSTVSGSSSSENYDYQLFFEKTKGKEHIHISSTSNGQADNNISAQVSAVISQETVELFEDKTIISAPPLVIAGCMTNAPTGGPDIHLLETSTPSIMTGFTTNAAVAATCLPGGTGGSGFDSETWSDDNQNRVMEHSEEGANITFERETFVCAGIGTHCVWNEFFDMSFDEAKHIVYEADSPGTPNYNISNSHIFDKTHLINCGEAASQPSIYIVRDRGPITTSSITGSCSGVGVDNKTIGTPDKPVIILVPGDPTDTGAVADLTDSEVDQDTDAGVHDTPGDYECPSIAAGITIYGIVYFESATCAAHGWGGATIYGSVLVEGDYNKPNSNTRFIETDYGNEISNLTYTAGVKYATRMPGTWKDF